MAEKRVVVKAGTLRLFSEWKDGARAEIEAKYWQGFGWMEVDVEERDA